MKETDLNAHLEAKVTSIATPNINWRDVLAPHNWEGDPNTAKGPYTFVNTISKARREKINRNIEDITQNGGVVVVDYDDGFVDILIGRTDSFQGGMVSLTYAQRKEYIRKNPLTVEVYKGNVSAEVLTLLGKIYAVKVSIDGIDCVTSDEFDSIKTPTLFTLRRKPPNMYPEASLLVTQLGDRYLVARSPRKAPNQA